MLVVITTVTANYAVNEHSLSLKLTG